MVQVKAVFDLMPQRHKASYSITSRPTFLASRLEKGVMESSVECAVVTIIHRNGTRVSNTNLQNIVDLLIPANLMLYK
jgi:hypothetical protein